MAFTFKLTFALQESNFTTFGSEKELLFLNKFRSGWARCIRRTAIGREALLLTEVHRSREVGRGRRRVCRQSVEVRDG